MMDFRAYEDEAKKVLTELQVKDVNWKWSVKQVTEKEILIGWEYLDYLEESDKSFKIEASDLPEEDDYAIYTRDALSEEFIDVFSLKYRNGVRKAVESIFYYARSRY